MLIPVAEIRKPGPEKLSNSPRALRPCGPAALRPLDVLLGFLLLLWPEGSHLLPSIASQHKLGFSVKLFTKFSPF